LLILTGEEKPMPYADLDYKLTEEQKAMRDMVRRFGAEVIRPAGIELDNLADPAQVIAKGSRLWDVPGQAGIWKHPL
jgi:hypothetical protein